MRLIYSLFIFLLLCIPIFSQEAILTNKEVIELVKAGLGEEVILAKIKSSECGFNTSSASLIELKNSGVSDNIILAIVEVSKPKKNKAEESKGFEKIKSIQEAEDQISRFYESKKFSVRYDRFKDLTRATAIIDVIPKPKASMFNSSGETNSHLSWVLGSFYSGNGILESPQYRLLCVDSSSPSWKFLKDNNLSLIVNSQRMSLGRGRWDGDVKVLTDVFVSEFICWTLEKSQIDSILNASDIEFQLGTLEASISPENIRLLKLYKDLLLPITNSRKKPSTFTLTDAFGKRKVFVETSDKQCETEIIKELKENKFDIVSDVNKAELILQFEVEQTDQIYVLGRPMERKWGKISVYLQATNSEGLIFTKSKKPSTFGQLLHKQAGSLTEDFIKVLTKTENQKNIH